MIKTLEAENFQPHKKTVLRFHPRINAVIGPSDSGKSSLILRTIRLLNYNRPAGDGYRSDWAKKEDVTRVAVENGAGRVERRRNGLEGTGKVNQYVIDGDEKNPLEAFGQGVPETVTKILNLNELNIQYQFSLPFLLFSGGAEVARFLNRLVDLDRIDIGFSKVESRRRKMNSQLNSARQRLNEEKGKLAKYRDLDGQEFRVYQLEKLQAEVEAKGRRLQNLISMVSNCRSLREEMKKYDRLEETERKIERLVALAKKTKKIEARIFQLETLLSKKASLRTMLDKAESVYEQSDREYRDLLEAHGICPTCGSEKRNWDLSKV